MDNEVIKTALSYSLGSDLHEAWRAPRKLGDGTYEPRMKTSKDDEWNKAHGTDQVDIANCSFEQLPSNWQYENLEAAKVVINLVFDRVMDNMTFSAEEIEQMAAVIHEEWLKRNNWVYDPQYGNPALAVPYDRLPKEEQDKDKAQLEPAIKKVTDFKNGLINVDEICSKYGINNERKQ